MHPNSPYKIAYSEAQVQADWLTSNSVDGGVNGRFTIRGNRTTSRRIMAVRSRRS